MKYLTIIGNFDGVHRGHQAVLRHASQRATERNLKPGHAHFKVMTKEFGQAVLEDHLVDGVMNIGLRPSVDKINVFPKMEVHLFSRSEDLYGKMIRVHLIEKIRDERKFSGLEELVSQIKKDVERAKLILLEFMTKCYHQ